MHKDEATSISLPQGSCGLSRWSSVVVSVTSGTVYKMKVSCSERVQTASAGAVIGGEQWGGKYSEKPFRRALIFSKV